MEKTEVPKFRLGVHCDVEGRANNRHSTLPAGRLK